MSDRTSSYDWNVIVEKILNLFWTVLRYVIKGLGRSAGVVVDSWNWMFHQYAKDKPHTEKLILAATQASVIVASILILVKVYAWITTGSMGVLAALVDSLLDLFASLVNMIAVRYALMPADEEHRFGHGKAEALAGLGQAAFISSSALFLIIFTIERLVNPTSIESVGLGTGVILFSIVLTGGLVAFQRHVVAQTGSVAIKADSLHYRADLLTNAGILLGLVLYVWGWESADPTIALLIGFYILKCAISIGYESIQLLLDRELPEDEQREILTIAQSDENVIEVHDLRTRSSGTTKFVQMHLVLDGHLTLNQAHQISDRIENALRQRFKNMDVIIHQDPDSERLQSP